MSSDPLEARSSSPVTDRSTRSAVAAVRAKESELSGRLHSAPAEPSDGIVDSLARFLPSWTRSVRFRLTLLYSLMLFGLASIMVGVMYAGIARSLNQQELITASEAARPGTPTFDYDTWEVDLFNDARVVGNQIALQKLQDWSFYALIALFFSSLVVGWFVAGRVLSPIDRITRVARDIQATDLSRRISLGGPDDELKQLADTFDAMLSRLDHAFAGQRRLIHEASHELRNPLAVIRTNLDVTLSDPGADFDDYKHTTEVVARNAERMSRLVDDLLAFARQDAEPTVESPVDVTDLIVGMSVEFAAQAEAEGLELSVDCTPGLWVSGDEAALEQAMSNLLSNAVRHAPAGSQLQLQAGQEQGWVFLAVEDNGPGISRSEAAKVFERGYRGSASRGSGLGLAIVRQIAEKHGGEVRLRSTPGRGARFSVWIPALVTSDPARDSQELKITAADKMGASPPKQVTMTGRPGSGSAGFDVAPPEKAPGESVPRSPDRKALDSVNRK